MLNFTTSKIVGIIGGVAGITTGGIGIAYLTNNSKEVKNEKVTPSNQVTTDTTVTEEKSISDWLNSDGVAILAEGDVAWNDNWKTFKSGYTKDRAPEAPWNLNDWGNAFSQDLAPSSFKSKCTSNASAKVSSKGDKRYIDLKKYCTKQTPSV